MSALRPHKHLVGLEMERYMNSIILLFGSGKWIDCAKKVMSDNPRLVDSILLMGK